MRSAHSPSIRSRYDYYYPPSSNPTNYYDNQHASLFGDPVPPSTGFIENLDNHLYGSLRRFSNSKPPPSTILDDFTTSSRYYSTPNSAATTVASTRENTVRADSSSGTEAERDTISRPNIIGDSIYSTEFNNRTNSASISSDFRANLDNFRIQHNYSPSSIPSKRLFTNDLYYQNGRHSSMDARNNNEWVNYKAGLDDWSNIPRLQQPTKHTSQINHGSLFSSSSSDEKAMPLSFSRSTNTQGPPLKYNINKYINVLPYQEKIEENENENEMLGSTSSLSEDELNQNQILRNEELMENEENDPNEMNEIRKETTLAIITDVITTGSSHRQRPSSRVHKKSSFTIINELSPTASRAPSPTPSSSGRLSPFLGRGFKPPISVFKHRNSFDALEYQSRPAVHFSNSLVTQPRSRSSLSLTPRSILQKRTTAESYDSETDCISKTTRYPNSGLKSTAIEGYKRRSYELLPFLRPNPKTSYTPSSRTYINHNRLYRSKSSLILDARFEPTNKRPPVNPRSYQKGMLKIVNGNPNGTQTGNSCGGKPLSPSKIPQPTCGYLASSQDTLNTAQSSRNSSPKKKLAKKPLKPNRTPSTKSTQTPETIPTSEKPETKRISIKKPLGRQSSNISTTSSGKVVIKKKLDPKDKGKEKTSSENSLTSLNKEVKDAPPVKKTFGNLAKNALKKPALSPIVGTPNVEPTPTPSARSEEKKEEPKPAAKATPSKATPSKVDPKKPEPAKQEPSGASSLSVEQKSPTKSMLSESVKNRRHFGLGSVSKAISFRSFGRKKKKEEGSDNESVVGSELQSQLSLKRADSQLSIKVPSTPSLSRFKNPLKRTPSFKSGDPNDPNATGPGSASSSRKDLSTAGLSVDKTSLLKRQISNISKKLTDQEVSKKLETISHDSGTENEKGERTLKLKHQEAEQKDNNDTPKGQKGEKGDKHLPMTKKNIVSMTTAAITSQPLQNISLVTNQLATAKKVESPPPEPPSPEREPTPPPEIPKQLELVPESPPQKDMAKTPKKNISSARNRLRKSVISEKPESKKNSFTDLILSDQVRAKARQSGVSSRPGSHRAEPNNNNNNNNNNNMQKTPRRAKKEVVDPDPADDMTERVSERAITVPPDVELESGYVAKSDAVSKHSDEKTLIGNKSEDTMMADGDVMDEGNIDFAYDDDTSQVSEEEPNGGGQCCTKRCKCCNPICMPCSKLIQICRRKKIKRKHSDSIQTDDEKVGCWKKFKTCCRRETDVEKERKRKMKSSSRPPPRNKDDSDDLQPRGKCRSCLDKVFCCKSTNRIESTDNGDIRKCCCIPCGKRKASNSQVAWAGGRRESVEQKGCCSRFCAKLRCCKGRSSRRHSMNSKKHSIAPTNPPEDNRPKLDLVLVEHSSMMKAAIPVLPICLAWFCGIFNFIIPGSGTIFSGLFCLCIGVPRFSQHDSARARIGSFVINVIVGVSQCFCLLFCLVGYGWSAWWGTIMIKTAKKHKKIRDAESHTQSPVTTQGAPPVLQQNHRDVEAGR